LRYVRWWPRLAASHPLHTLSPAVGEPEVDRVRHVGVRHEHVVGRHTPHPRHLRAVCVVGFKVAHGSDPIRVPITALGADMVTMSLDHAQGVGEDDPDAVRPKQS